jgi:hydroxyacylglutathione hydrolase
MLEIIPLPAFNDNYIWAIINTDTHSTIIVDPGDAEPVLALLTERNLTLEAILITHHHWDHTDGVTTLTSTFDVPVYGPNKEATALSNHQCNDGDTVTLNAAQGHFKVIDIPGHTAGHIAYYEPTQHWLFCGDTLFAAGCGRVFEGTYQQMHQSLSTLARLPKETQVFCGHEYTLANLAFAKIIEPNNIDIQQRIETVTQLRHHHQPSLPSTIALELKTNPFLRHDQTTVIQAAEKRLKKSIKDPVTVFQTLRQWKDNF